MRTLSAVGFSRSPRLAPSAAMSWPGSKSSTTKPASPARPCQPITAPASSYQPRPFIEPCPELYKLSPPVQSDKLGRSTSRLSLTKHGNPWRHIFAICFSCMSPMITCSLRRRLVRFFQSTRSMGAVRSNLHLQYACCLMCAPRDHHPSVLSSPSESDPHQL